MVPVGMWADKWVTWPIDRVRVGSICALFIIFLTSDRVGMAITLLAKSICRYNILASPWLTFPTLDPVEPFPSTTYPPPVHQRPHTSCSSLSLRHIYGKDKMKRGNDNSNDWTWPTMESSFSIVKWNQSLAGIVLRRHDFYRWRHHFEDAMLCFENQENRG